MPPAPAKPAAVQLQVRRAAPPAPAQQRRSANARDQRPPPRARGSSRRRTDATVTARNRVFASPLARRLAKEAGIDVARIQGSGPHGRVIARDVEAAKSGKGLARPAAAPAPAAPAAPRAGAVPDDKIRALFEPGSYEVVPHDNMRKIIARRLVEAKQTIPHFYLTVDCNIDKLLAAREEINAAAPKDKDGKPAYKLSVNDFVIKALALALQRVPDANVTWTEGGMLKHKHSDVGVAVVDPGRADHAGRPPGRDEIALGHLERDEGPRRARARRASSSRRNIRAARRRSPISACTASRISPP